MKTVIYIDNAVVQLVLTPENEWEKKAVTMFAEGPLEAEVFHASFSTCAGGWTRLYGDRDVNSLILRAKVEAK